MWDEVAKDTDEKVILLKTSSFFIHIDVEKCFFPVKDLIGL